MNCIHALSIVQRLRDFDDGVRVGFVSPVISTTLASLSTTSLREKICELVSFLPECEGYAANNGLLDAIRGNYQFPTRSGKQGLTFTKLTRLATHDEVDRCNEIVNDLFFAQLSGFDSSVVGSLAKVVGELHDNVASHADGTGFSCAQVYDNNGNKRIQFAIADAGRGMLGNVRRIKSDIQDHTAAVQWCMGRGNTTAGRNFDPWAQRLPDDAVVSPFPSSSRATELSNHHVGEGLWKLAELVRGLQGCLTVISGDGQFGLENGQERSESCRSEWNGVLVAFELVVSLDSRPTPEQQVGIEALAGRIGL